MQATEHLNAFIQDCDRRTELAKKRLAETQEELSAEVSSKAEKVHELAESIGKKLAQAEQAGAEGKVEESMKFMEEVEDIRKKKVAAEMEYRNSMPASSYQQQKLRVCEVCSAYLGIHDNDRRLADHFGGKLHLGFIKIREKLEELLVSGKTFDSTQEFIYWSLQKTYEDRKTKRRETRIRDGLPPTSNADFGYVGDGGGREASSRDDDQKRRRSRSRDRGHRRRHSRSRSRSRDRHRGHRRSHKRDRSRSRDRRRSRSRDRYRSSRRSRSRSREDRRSKSRRSPASADVSPGQD